jgi:peroxiredoxin
VLIRVASLVGLLSLVALLPVPTGAAALAAPAAPGFRVSLLDGGQPFDSRDRIGKKILVLRFQASWCRPCASESAGLSRLADRYRPLGVEVLAIHVQDTAADARRFVRAANPSYPVALDPRLTLANRYAVRGTPFTVVVDRRGEIAARLPGESVVARLPRLLDGMLAGEKRR